MSKAVIKIDNADGKKAYVALTACNIDIKDRKKIGEKSILELNVRNPADLFEAGQLFTKVTGNEIEEKATEKAPKK